MTIIDSKMFKKIQIQEWLHKGWTKEGKSKHLVAFINRFNLVSNWVSMMSCMPDRVETRTIAIDYFLHVAMVREFFLAKYLIHIFLGQRAHGFFFIRGCG
jgi:hypothetical protein